MFWYSALFISLIIPPIYPARILCVFQFPSYSHQIVYQPLWKALSLRGHQVTVITPNPLKDTNLTNLTEIDTSSVGNFLTSEDALQNSMSKEAPSTEIMEGFYRTSAKLFEGILGLPEVVELYNDSTTKFDLVITECLHPGMYSLAAKFRALAIGMSSLGVVVATHSSLGNPIHPVLFPDMNMAEHEQLNWRQKLHSVYFSMWLLYYYNYVVLPESDTIARKYLGGNLPYLDDVGRDVSLVFVNTNPFIYTVRPNVPTVITLGLMHLKFPEALSEDLQFILDESDNGVIYFSLGSNVKPSKLPKNLQSVMLNTISSLPYTVLWKVDSELLDIEDLPKNVYIRKWFPQSDLLVHPNVKVFVTQGGLQSIEEAIVRGVPMVGLPFFGDQAMNVRKISRAGIGIEVDPTTATVRDLRAAILEVAQNSQYRLKIQEVAKILVDQPMSSVEKAVWWTEYVIRNNGTKILRSPTADSVWWQYFLLDIIGIVFVVIFICYKSIWWMSGVSREN